MAGYTIDTSTLTKRLQSLYSHWRENKDELWGSCNAFAIATPPPSEDLRYLKSSALNLWLFGYEFPETIIVFSEKQIHFICTPKKATILDIVKKCAKDAVNVDVLFLVKSKNEDGSTQMDAVIRDVSDALILGYIAKEASEGKILEKWAEKVKASWLQLSDITNGLGHLFAVKDDNELINVKKAACLTASVMKMFVYGELETIIDEEKKVMHSRLMEATENVILKPSEIKLKLKADNVDICYPPIFQSGENFDLKPSAFSNDDYLKYDSGNVIICAIGSRYKSYCANVARTFLVDCNTTQIKVYNVLFKAHGAAIGAIKPGNKANDVYKAAVSVVEKEAPELNFSLTKSCGTGIGLEFRESGLSLNEKNERVLKPGMVLNVSLGLQNLQIKSSKKSRNYALLVADTVIVTANGREVVTSFSSKDIKDVGFFFDDGEKEEEVKVKVEPERTERLKSKTALRSDNLVMSKEEVRRKHQAELARWKNEETAQRLAGGKTATGVGKSSSRVLNDLNAYENVNDIIPPQTLMICIDQRHEAILLPICGNLVPFHVSTVKKVSSDADTSGNSYIRIVFHLPGTPFSTRDSFFRDICFRSKDSRHINELDQQINALRKKVISRESEKAERASLVSQEKLVISGNKSKPIRLMDLSIRPVFGGRGRKLPGTLEAHENGLRYSTSRVEEHVDILFGNIKHAIFQPAEKELITLLHFHLHNHIMVGKKKTIDVQFYVEVMDVVQTIGSGKRSMYDPDEIEEEQRERDRKNKINMGFQSFCERVNDLWRQPKFQGLDLEFDIPMRELGFHGVPHKASAFVVPTSTCLVELIETPFFVVTLSEIEIVNLERVGLGQKNFDLAIVFKDFKRDILRIDSIPSTSLDGIKEWLDTTDIKYYESKLNMNWRTILKTIIDDPQNFINEGGWEFLNLEGNDSESDDKSEELDQVYTPSDVECESESESEDEDSASNVESDDDVDEEEEEDGMTWEELEKEATNADMEMGDESDSDVERKRRSMKVLGKSRAGPSTSASKRPKFRR